jgi:hypothetical protein
MDCERRMGTVTALQYTRLAGAPVAIVAIDDPLDDGRERVAMGLDELDYRISESE